MVARPEDGLAAALLPPIFKAANLKEFRTFERSCAMFFRHHDALFNSDQEKSDFIASRLAEGPTQDQFYKRWPSYESLQDVSLSEVMKFLRAQCIPKGSALCEIAQRWFYARQSPGQKAISFLAYLQSLEADLPTKFESEKALRFLTGLLPETQEIINEGENDYPLTTKYILERATEYEKRYNQPVKADSMISKQPIPKANHLPGKISTKSSPSKIANSNGTANGISDSIKNPLPAASIPNQNALQRNKAENDIVATGNEDHASTETEPEEPMDIDTPPPPVTVSVNHINNTPGQNQTNEPVYQAQKPATNGASIQTQKSVTNGITSQVNRAPTNGTLAKPTNGRVNSSPQVWDMGQRLNALLQAERQGQNSPTSTPRQQIQIPFNKVQNKTPRTTANPKTLSDNTSREDNVHPARRQAINNAYGLANSYNTPPQSINSKSSQQLQRSNAGLQRTPLRYGSPAIQRPQPAAQVQPTHVDHSRRESDSSLRRSDNDVSLPETPRRKTRFDEQCRRCNSLTHTVHNCPLRPRSPSPPSYKSTSTIQRYDSYKPAWDAHSSSSNESPAWGEKPDRDVSISRGGRASKQRRGKSVRRKSMIRQ